MLDNTFQVILKKYLSRSIKEWEKKYKRNVLNDLLK